MSSLVHSANPCCCKVKLVVSECTLVKDPPPKEPGLHTSDLPKIIIFWVGEISYPNYAWNGFGGIGVEMQRRTSSPQQEPCPAYTASKFMTSCFILYDFDMSEFFSDSNEE